MKHATPIIDAVRAMHIEQDNRDLARGFDPYNSRARRAADIAALEAARKHEASEILACYETHLTIEE